MKNLAMGAFSLLISAFLLLFLPTEADAAIYDDTIRLHVLANSDSEFDQNIKMAVRDYLLETYGAALYAEEIESAKANAQNLIPEMESAVDQMLEKSGVTYRCRITLSEENYDTRTYESFQMPSGNYLSLRVILGSGEGKNWWCVMYPPMCLDLCTDTPVTDISYSQEELNLIGDTDYQIKFKLLEVASDVGHKIKKKN